MKKFANLLTPLSDYTLNENFFYYLLFPFYSLLSIYENIFTIEFKTTILYIANIRKYTKIYDIFQYTKIYIYDRI